MFISVSTSYPIESVSWSSSNSAVSMVKPDYEPRRVSKKLRKMAKKARKDLRRGKLKPLEDLWEKQ